MRLLVSVLAAMAATGCTKEQMLAVAGVIDNPRPTNREERLRQREARFLLREERLSKKEARLGNGAAK
jgi:hypothetical protein